MSLGRVGGDQDRAYRNVLEPFSRLLPSPRPGESRYEMDREIDPGRGATRGEDAAIVDHAGLRTNVGAGLGEVVQGMPVGDRGAAL
ncbi:MAG: hypothetical protein ABI323_13765, partial [Solirubrobacteraceae bacterium]